MNTLVLFLALTTWFGLGYPIARCLGPVQWTALAAPPIGLAIDGMLTPLVYLHGATASVTCAICLGLAVPGVFLGLRDARRRSWSRTDTLIVIATFAAFLLVILPKWLGSPDFSVFQGNIGDQFWYLTNAFTASRFDAAAINRMYAGVLELGFPQVQRSLSLRPEAMLMLAGFASFLRRPVLLTSYAYLASFQVCLFFSTAFVVQNLFGLTPLAVLSIAVAAATGFFVQYVFDINAWSHLASIAPTMLAVGMFIMQITSDRVRFDPNGLFLAFAACLSGLIYIYLETLPIICVAMVSMLVYQAFMVRGRELFRRLVPMLFAGAVALTLCALSWDLTVNYFIEGSRFVTDPSYTSKMLDWWKYSQAYLFGYDNDPATAFSSILNGSFFGALSATFSLITSFLAGVLGVYFLQPSLNI